MLRIDPDGAGFTAGGLTGATSLAALATLAALAPALPDIAALAALDPVDFATPPSCRALLTGLVLLMIDLPIFVLLTRCPPATRMSAMPSAPSATRIQNSRCEILLKKCPIDSRPANG